MDGCIFCRIVEGKIPADKIMETANVLVIEDKHPQAPKHYLVMPKKHLQDLMSIAPGDKDLLSEIYQVIQQVALKKGLEANGFRVVANHGANGGQTIFHLHFHILGGRLMNWPPG